jgi:hypothetical protein
MFRISKTLTHGLDSTYIAEIFMSNSGRITTICGSRILNEKVRIKVCYMKFHWNGRRVYIITLKLEFVLSQRV